jgi:acylpyruvate hydrolase
MKIISYLRHGQTTYGIVAHAHATHLQAVPISQVLRNAPPTVEAFIALCKKDSSLLASLAATVESEAHVRVEFADLLPCMPAPGKIICLGVNYVDHAAEGGNVVADYPALFLRAASSLAAHGNGIQRPAISSKLDYEAELAVIMGQRIYAATEAQALDAVFGYSCFNDGTLRDYQKRTSQWTIGKNFDRTGGFGPWIVTADALPPGCDGLHIESRLNGQVMQSANTSDMVFKVAQTLSLLSQCLTLEVGDVVVMGTPAGVGYARKPPVWMKPGDTIEIDIEGIGILSNTIVDAPSSVNTAASTAQLQAA